MLIDKLYRSRLKAAAIFGILAIAFVVLAIVLRDPGYAVAAATASAVAITVFVIARAEYRADKEIAARVPRRFRRRTRPPAGPVPE